ncbi:MAG: hypothetical protein AAF533_04340 [Acidobacteriota bacterium]
MSNTERRRRVKLDVGKTWKSVHTLAKDAHVSFQVSSPKLGKTAKLHCLVASEATNPPTCKDLKNCATIDGSNDQHMGVKELVTKDSKGAADTHVFLGLTEDIGQDQYVYLFIDEGP